MYGMVLVTCSFLDVVLSVTYMLFDHLQEISLDLAPESKFFIVWLLQYGNNPTVWFTGLWN